MFNPSDSNTPHGYSGDTSTTPTLKRRTQQACVPCRSRKQKCDGVRPCQQCSDEPAKCHYAKTEPTGRDAALDEIRLNTRQTLEILRPPRSPGALHSRSLHVDQKTRTTLFLSTELHELFKAYIAYGHDLHPIVDAPREMYDDFIKQYSDTAAIRRDSITSHLRNANVLLFLALGSCLSTQDCSGNPSTPPGMAYYHYAQGILDHKREEQTVALAQTMTLAALYTNQFGRLQESWENIRVAYEIYIRLGYYTDVPVDSPAVRNGNPELSDEGKRTSWICRSLARGIRDCLGLVSSDLHSISGSDMLPVKSLEKGSGGVHETRMLLRKMLDEVQKHSRMDTKRLEKDDLDQVMNIARSGVEIMGAWRSTLPSWLAWKDEELPSTDPLMASLRAEYYGSIAEFLRPCLYILLHECHTLATDKLSAGQRGLTDVLNLWVKPALASIISLDRINAVVDSAYEPYQESSNIPVLLSNPVQSLHSEFQNVLIFWAIHFSAIYPLLAEQTLPRATMDAVSRRTVRRLSTFWPRPQQLDQDLVVLSTLGFDSEWVDVLALVGISIRMGAGSSSRQLSH